MDNYHILLSGVESFEERLVCLCFGFQSLRVTCNRNRLFPALELGKLLVEFLGQEGHHWVQQSESGFDALEQHRRGFCLQLLVSSSENGFGSLE